MNPSLLNEEEVFRIARLIPNPEGRSAYLKQVCGDDSQLFERVVALLNATAEDQSFLENPPEGMAPTIDSRPITEKPGDVIGPFKLLQKIGEGGFGVVYMAEQTRPVRRKVALKVIKPGMDTKEVIARFEAERQALAMMNHPNIAKVLDGGETESGLPYFVMELVNGITLTKFCDEQKLSTKERLRLFMLVCSAIQHAHQKGVIHRDIKPSNIMITLNDGQPVPKVIDFGVSKAINQQLTEWTLFTSYGQMVGTPQYMSPEQAEMTGLDVDTRSDIYSLGVVLYELLTGTTPLEVEKLRTAGFVEMQRLIKEQEPPKPSTRVSGVSDRVTAVAKQRGISAEALRRSLRGDLDWIVMKAIDKDRNRRYDTAKGFALDIGRFLTDEPVSACPPSTSYLLRKLVHRYRKPVFIGLSICLVGLIGLMGTSVGWYKTSQAKAEKEVARLDAIAAQTEAEEALLREQDARNSLEDRNRSQSLTMAFDAFNFGNTKLSRELLGECDGFRQGSASELAWRFLDRRCREQLGTHLPLDETVRCFAADPLGEFYAFGFESGDIALFAPMSNQQLALVWDEDKSMESSRPGHLAISSDGKWMVASRNFHAGKGQLWLWKLERANESIVAKRIDRVMTHPTNVMAVDIDVRDSRILCKERNGKLVLWDLHTQQQLAERLTEVPWATRGITFSPTNSSAILPGGSKVQFYSLDELEVLREIQYREEGNAQSVSITPDGTILAVAGYQGTQIWDLTNEQPVCTLKLSWRRSTCCVFSGDGRYLAVADSDHQSIWIYERDTWLLLERLYCDSLDDHSRLTFDGQEVVCINARSIDRYNLQFRAKRAVKSSGFWYAPFATSPSRPVVAFPATANSIGLWDVVTGETKVVTSHNDAMITAVALSSTGNVIAIARKIPGDSNSHNIEVCVFQNGLMETISNLIGHKKRVWSLSFSPADDLLVSAGEGGEVILWDLSTRTHQRLHGGEGKSDGTIISAQFSPSGKHVVFGGVAWQNSGGQAEYWSIDKSRTARPRGLIPTIKNYSCVFNSDGSKISFINMFKDAVEVFDLPGMGFSASGSLSTSRIMSIDISPNDECLVASSPSGAIVFVDFRTMEEIATFRIDRPLRHVKFLDGYDRLIVSTMDGSIMKFEY